MAVRRIPPNEELKEGDELYDLRKTPLPDRTHLRVEDFFSFDEALWRAELRQTKHQTLGFELLTLAAQCLKDFMPLVDLKDGVKQKRITKMVKDLEIKIEKAKILDPTNMTPEMEYMLFEMSLVESMVEYDVERLTLGYEASYLVSAKHIAHHYWRYDKGSVLDSAGKMDIEVEFRDIDGEVAKIMAADNITAREARTKIMDRAVHAVRTIYHGAEDRTFLRYLKKADPVRFKDVTELGVIPEPVEEETEEEES